MLERILDGVLSSSVYSDASDTKPEPNHSDKKEIEEARELTRAFFLKAVPICND